MVTRSLDGFGGFSGYTLVELLLVIAMFSTLAGLAMPLWASTTDHLQVSAAARHLSGRIAQARLDAVRRSSVVGFQFQPGAPDYQYTLLLDGNGNGLRSADVTAGVDSPLGQPERLADAFRDVQFGLIPGLPDLNGSTGSTNGVRIGATSFLSLTPAGTATGGTLYVRGRHAQFAVRVLGATGRTRVFVFDRGAGQWIAK